MMFKFLSLLCSGFFLVQRMSAHMGSHEKPALCASPSYIVPQGQNVTLTCDSHSKSNLFKVYKEDGFPIPRLHETTFLASHVIGPVSSAHGGTYRCFHYQYPNEISAHSEPLKIIISGIYMKPFLLAPQTPLANSGENVTLECHSEVMFDTYILILHRMEILKETWQHFEESHFRGSYASFTIGPMTPDYSGTYTCYGAYNHSSYEWSDSSDPVDIKITGEYKKPSLSSVMSPVLVSEENITLSCTSNHQFDMFHLSREGVPQGKGMPAMQSHGGKFEAKFLLSPVIQKGSYRCYGSFKNSSHVWSSPSDPLYLPAKDNIKNLHIEIGLSVTVVLVFIIIIIYYYYFYFSKKSKSQKQSGSISEQESEVKETINRQGPERKEEQKLVYIEFEQRIFNKNLMPPNSQNPKEFSIDTVVYTEVRK